ncbi:MAG: ATP-binding protein [Bacteroidota bacterium]|nr:ATP-binding protein [Bacteroidota bacterium]
MNPSTHETAISIIVATLLFLLLAGFIIAFFIIFQKRRKEYLAEKINLQNNFQQELLKTQLEIQEQTFQNISQEIHDNIGQTLSFIKLNINTVSYEVSGPDKEKLTESKNLLTKVIQDLRDLSKTLNTDFIKEIGLVKAIEQQLQILQKTGVYKTELMVTGEAFELSLHFNLVVFRVVQEALNNAVKHAEASSINISINYQSDELVIIVKDNGKGCDIEELESNKGIGFRNMVNRMQLIKGSVKVNSISEKGTSIIIQLLK